MQTAGCSVAARVSRTAVHLALHWAGQKVWSMAGRMDGTMGAPPAEYLAAARVDWTADRWVFHLAAQRVCKTADLTDDYSADVWA